MSVKSHWWKEPVIAWALSIDPPSTRREPRWIFSVAITGPYGPGDEYGDGTIDDSDSVGKETVRVVPAVPGTWKICSYVSAGAKSKNAVLGYEYPMDKEERDCNEQLRYEEERLAAEPITVADRTAARA